MAPYALVTTQDQLNDYCQRWRAAGRFAFDTEFIRDETFDATLCLIQVNADGEVALVDPAADVDVTPFWELVSDPELVTIVHAGKEDFEICLSQTGQPPRNVFDVQIAAGFVGYPYPLSLVRLVDAVRRKRLSKGQTMTDWLRRPLTKEQLKYAVDDVLHLPAIYDKLLGKLRASDREGWACEEFARLEDPDYYKPPTGERVYKIKGAGRLNGQQLAVLGEVINWRDAWAKRRNRPARAMMRDDVLVEIAKRQPTEASELQVLRGFPQAKNSEVVRQLLDTIAQARQIPEQERPKPAMRREETPMMRACTDLLLAVLRAICHRHGVSQDLVGSTQRLRELIDHSLGRLDERPLLLTGWRESFIGTKLLEVLEGGGEVHLSGWPDDPRFEIIHHRNQNSARDTEVA